MCFLLLWRLYLVCLHSALCILVTLLVSPQGDSLRKHQEVEHAPHMILQDSLLLRLLLASFSWLGFPFRKHPGSFLWPVVASSPCFSPTYRETAFSDAFSIHQMDELLTTQVPQTLYPARFILALTALHWAGHRCQRWARQAGSRLHTAACESQQQRHQCSEETPAVGKGVRLGFAPLP